MIDRRGKEESNIDGETEVKSSSYSDNRVNGATLNRFITDYSVISMVSSENDVSLQKSEINANLKGEKTEQNSIQYFIDNSKKGATVAPTIKISNIPASSVSNDAPGITIKSLVDFDKKYISPEKKSDDSSNSIVKTVASGAYQGIIDKIDKKNKRFSVFLKGSDSKEVETVFTFSDLRREHDKEIMCEGMGIVFRTFDEFETISGETLRKKVYYVEVIHGFTKKNKNISDALKELKKYIEESVKKI